MPGSLLPHPLLLRSQRLGEALLLVLSGNLAPHRPGELAAAVALLVAGPAGAASAMPALTGPAIAAGVVLTRPGVFPQREGGWVKHHALAHQGISSSVKYIAPTR
jgi:hypothetical protein